MKFVAYLAIILSLIVMTLQTKVSGPGEGRKRRSKDTSAASDPKPISYPIPGRKGRGKKK